MTIKKIISFISVLAICSGLIPSAYAAKASGWDEYYSYGPKVTTKIDTETRFGNPVFYIKSEQQIKANCYYDLSTPLNLKGGKTYIYGATVKVRQAAGMYMQLDWIQRNSILVLGSTFDWTEIGCVYTPGSDGTVSLKFIVDQPGELWIDDAFCYEYVNGKKVGENLIQNGSFGGADLSSNSSNNAEQKETVIIDDSTLDNTVTGIVAADTFSLATLEKVYGGTKFIPAYPIENVTIDGKADEWGDYPYAKLPTLSSQYYAYTSAKKDAFGYFRFAYDDKNLYLIAEMHDDVLQPQSSAYSYWMVDTIQLALSKFGETYGKELTFGFDESYNPVIFGGDETIEIMATHNEDKTVSTYELAIPWEFSYGEKPEKDILMTALYNDNDGSGRAYTAEWTPGISEGKYNTLYPHMKLLEKDDDFLWFDGDMNIQNEADNPYRFYYVNTSDRDKTVKISIPYCNYEEEVTVAAKTGIGRNIILRPDGIGNDEIIATVTEGENVICEALHEVIVNPNIKKYDSDFFADREKDVAEIKKLMGECEAKGIPVKYEQINLSLVERFIPMLERILTTDAQITRIDNTGSTIESLCEEAIANLKGYLDGTKIAKDVPIYVTGRPEVKGNDYIATAKWNDGRLERRPMFFIGVGHFASAQNDIPNLPDLGMNTIQMELGISSILKTPGGISSWSVTHVGGFPMTIELSDEEARTGSHSAKIVIPQEAIPECYRYISQTINLEPNTTYEWGLSAKAKNAGGQVWFSKDGWNNTHSLTGTYDWKDFKFTYTTGDKKEDFRLMVMLADKTDALYLDDMFIRVGSKGENLFKNGGFENNAPIIGDSMVDSDAIAEVERVLKNAEENNVSVCLLLSPHYFPGHLTDKYPEMDVRVSNFIYYDLMHEKAREATALYIKTLIPVISKYKSLSSICLTNEPQNPGKYEQMAPWWRSYLYEKYNGDINALNEAWGTSFKNFNVIPISGSADNSQEVNLAVDWEHIEEDTTIPTEVKYTESPFSLEWNKFVDLAFAEYHQFLADEVHKYAPDIPVHSKVMSHDSGTGIEVADGTDYELFGQFSDMHGNDAWEVFSPDTSGQSITPLHHKTLMYEQQRSTKDMPVINTEDHILLDGDKYWGYEHAVRIYSDMWQGGIHGRAASVIWLWEQTDKQTESFYGLLHSRPDCIRSVGYANYDLNRLAYQVSALQDAKPTVGVIRSKTSKTYTANSTMSMAHSAGLMAGQKVDSIVDNQIKDIHNYKLIVLPELTHITEANLAEIEKFVQNGGKIVGFGENLLAKDDYDRPHDAARVAEILKNADIYPSWDDKNKEYWYDICDYVRKAVVECGLMNVEVVDANTGEPVYNVEWQTAEYDGKLLVNLCSYKWYETKNVKVLVNGEAVTSSKELISGEDRGEVIQLEEYTPQLLEI